MTRLTAHASRGESPHRAGEGSAGSTAVAFTAAAIALGNASSASAAIGQLLVYLHVAVKQRAFQGLLSAGLPGVTATAVGRIADFDRAIQEAPDAVLTLPLVLAEKGLSPALRGAMRGSTEERYALVGIGASPDPSRVAKVGALDILGREGSNRFVRSLVGAQAHVERVTKFEDLLPLLQMQRVEAVLLPSRLISDLRAASRLPLTERELQATVGLPAVASTGPNASSVLGAIRKLPKDTSKLFGVDEWP
jgi:hypothetical protein